jgi:Flp pilus assembly protein TadG
MSAPRASSRRPRGQALVETAIVVPLMLLLFMATVDAGRLLFAYIALEEAVHEGATYAAQMPADTSGIRARVTTSSDHREVTNATVPDPVCTTATVSVTATYPMPVLTPLAGALFGGSITLGSTVVATNLQGSCS